METINDCGEPVGDDARHAAWLARILGVDPSTISKAVPEAGGPPFTRDPATGRKLYPTSAFLRWWDARPGPGRPRKNTAADRDAGRR
ncbi:hypothetical protein [Actinomadura violacea]|uniref:DNA-binding protein n=1 Tax=Actinomadura violacea TaxID=2819934 RepID=A0ABS3RY52_9ACTN|nr:hypothetical protein [Actinomadura violacea]MBO2461670.1 hypothetical protein [Actinomadura violacea]